MEVNERFSWAAAIIAPKPASVLLEIGCGAGILAELIADTRKDRYEIMRSNKSQAGGKRLSH